MLENLEMSNKDVEQQINDEITHIRARFQGKLKELCSFPKKYDQARLKFEKSKEQLTNLETDLKAAVAALCTAWNHLKSLQGPDESVEEKYQKLQCEVAMLRRC